MRDSMTALLLARKVAVVLRQIPGTYPIINALRKRFYDRGVVTVSDFDGSLRMELNLGEHMASQVFWFGYYSRDVLYAIEKLLRLGDAFFDVGANVGEVSLFAARRVGPTGLVMAFEPIAAIAGKLRRNVQLNQLRNIEVFEVGVSDETGEAPIYAASGLFDDGSRHQGLGTLYASKVRAERVGSATLTTLDAFVEAEGVRRVDGIKLDIEGAELAALRGAETTLKRFRPWLVIEIGEETCQTGGYEPGAIFDFLDSFGYETWRIERKGRLEPVGKATLKPWQNVLCRHRH
jgi:FkbM family methyltransferase